MTLREVFSSCRSFFVYGGVFSFFSGLLALASTLYMLQVFNRVLLSRSLETLAVLSAIVLCAFLADALLDAVRARLFIRLGDTVYIKLREPVLNAVMWFGKRGAQHSHGMDDLDTIRNFLAGPGLKAAFEIPWIPIFVWVLWLFHPVFAVLAIASAVILFLLTVLEEMVTKRSQVAASAKRRESVEFIAQAFRNVEAVTAMAMHSNMQRRWQIIDDGYLHESFRANRKISGITAVSKFTRTVLSAAAIAAAAVLVITVPGISPAIMLASTIIMGKATAPLVMVLNSWKTFIQFRGAYRKLDALLRESQALREGFQNPAPQGRLAVERLLFFMDRERTILNGVDFTLEPGEALGVIGASASGKTTLARLLVGLTKPSDGVVRLDGADVHQWAHNGMGAHIGYLPQDQQLFAGTVAENIARMGDAYANVEAVVDAARRAGVHDLILGLPAGYDTQIGSGGAALSGGQRQLVALARALFGRPRFVVMDEPNSNLDGPSELLLMEVMRNLKDEGVTVVIIAHKPSVLQDMDKLLVLGQGRQLMFGPRDEVFGRLGHAGMTAVTAASDRSSPADDIAA
jgi:PrtD family type I secretion system ABC transporter